MLVRARIASRARVLVPSDLSNGHQTKGFKKNLWLTCAPSFKPKISFHPGFLSNSAEPRSPSKFYRSGSEDTRPPRRADGCCTLPSALPSYIIPGSKMREQEACAKSHENAVSEDPPSGASRLLRVLNSSYRPSASSQSVHGGIPTAPAAIRTRSEKKASGGAMVQGPRGTPGRPKSYIWDHGDQRDIDGVPCWCCGICRHPLKFYKAAGGWTFRRQEEARLHLSQEHEIMDPDEDNGMCPGENSTAVSPSNTAHTAPFVAGLNKATTSRSSNGGHDGDHIKANSLCGGALSGLDAGGSRTPCLTKPAIVAGREVTDTSDSDDEASLRKRRRLHRNSGASTTEATGPPPLLEGSTLAGALDSVPIGHMQSMFDHDGIEQSDTHPNHPSAISSAAASLVQNSPTNDARHWAEKEASYKHTIALLVADHDRVIRSWEDQRTVLMAERDDAYALQSITELSRQRVADILLRTRNMIHVAYGSADSEIRPTLQALGANIECSLYLEDRRVAREREALA